MPKLCIRAMISRPRFGSPLHMGPMTITGLPAEPENTPANTESSFGADDRISAWPLSGEPVGSGRGNEIIGCCAPCDSGDFGLRIHIDLAHPGEIDDEPVVTQGSARPVVAAAAYRKRKAVRPRYTQCGLNVPGGPAQCDQCGLVIHRAVPDLAGAGIGDVATHYDLTCHDLTQVFCGRQPYWILPFVVFVIITRFLSFFYTY